MAGGGRRAVRCADAGRDAARPHGARPRQREAGFALGYLILKAGIPCIVVPHHGGHFEPFERVAIGWNGSPEAMRAVHSALPFMQGKRALLLWGEEREKYHGVEWEPPFNINDYLRQRDITVEQRTVDAKNDDVGGVLLDEAMRFGADLLVMGAYGRTRFSEWMLGGATRHVLAWANIPVLLRH